MSLLNAENKAQIIQAVTQKIAQKMPKNQGKLCTKLLQQLYDTVALDDLKSHTIEDLCGSAIMFWNFVHERKPEQVKIRIYNPDYEKHGWQSTHTIIEIIQEDMPFLVDSIRMEINRLNFTIHWMMHMGGMRICRNDKHQITNILAKGKATKETVIEEAPLYIEIDRQTDPEVLKKLEVNLTRILQDVRMAVNDWCAMRQKVMDAVDALEQVKQYLDVNEFKETKDFLAWIKDDHFTFLGVCDYDLVKTNDDQTLCVIPDSGLGILSCRGKGDSAHRSVLMTPEARRLILSPQILLVSKTDTLSTIHRPTYADYIAIKRFNKNGEVIGERRIIGLFTSIAYNTNPKRIPFLRRKVATVMAKTGISEKSHAGKALLNILETLPRDDLFQASIEELLDLVTGIYHLQERRRIRMFIRKDVYGRFVSCLVYVPRDHYNTVLHKKMQRILQEFFVAREITYFTLFSDSVLARIHFVIRIDPENVPAYNVEEIEKKLVEVGRSWEDELSNIVLDTFGEEKGNYLINKYSQAFSASYREEVPPRTAVYDIKHIERLTDSNNLEINFYLPIGARDTVLRLKVYQYDSTIPLSDVIPILENMGLRVISEHPYALRCQDGRSVWINDFGMEYFSASSFYLDDVKELLQEAFAKVWFCEAKSDSLNRLVLTAALNWREISILRSYAKYLRQTRFTFSQEYIEHALTRHADVAKNLIALFSFRFDPDFGGNRANKVNAAKTQLLKAIDAVENLDEDRILRRYLDLVLATIRTNFFQRNHNVSYKPYLSFKFDPATIPGMPVPVPQYEIFIYSPHFEGVHLRGAKVARGGIRWSDRREDFRTEILGLMKAQQVKNAVIVPAGAKGGFVPKNLPADGSREAIMAEAIACYQNFIRGLLDITDNLKEGKIVKPANVICYDEDDPYLVVAADKGTATFSDIANEISLEYGFWLGDAFASGGSTGYDHKKMGITARGAWESVKRHFRELDRNIQTSSFTVVGIGDMAGDVFGNGMLLSKHIKLVAAFNHLHIFLDPDPNVKKSFAERERLYNLPRSAWTDYDPDLISKGGGVFNRSAKSINLTPEIKKLLKLKQNSIVPNDLICAILRASVDLLWCAGIGTYVKSKLETNADVGDKNNDDVRINADELRCKVVGEGANLSFTQLARIEYALNDGLIYTDFIDNSAGVDCSDHEVNIKILLNDIVANGDMTEKQRNQLLVDMTDEVAQSVLYNNYKQSQAISIATIFAVSHLELYGRYIDYLESQGALERSLEFLPDDKVLMERKLHGKGLMSCGIAVLLAYSKILIKEAILNSDVPEDPYLCEALVLAFPQVLRDKYRQQMENHHLCREIIATQVSNTMVNEMGLTFAFRQTEETGELVPSIVRAYTIARVIFNMDEICPAIEALDNKIPAKSQMNIMSVMMYLLNGATHWILRNRRGCFDIASTVDYFAADIKALQEILPSVLGEKANAYVNSKLSDYLAWGIPKKLAHYLAQARFLFFSLDVIEIARESGLPLRNVAIAYFAIGEYLDLDWLRLQIFNHPSDNHWESLSKEALRDDLSWQQRKLTLGILKQAAQTDTIEQSMHAWLAKYGTLIERWQHMLGNLRVSTTINFTMFYVATRELLDITQTTSQAI